MDQLSLKDQRNIPRRRLPDCGEIAHVFRELGVTRVWLECEVWQEGRLIPGAEQVLPRAST